LLFEGFNDVRTLPVSGWVLINNSSPPGSTDWFQGDPAVFPAAAGPAESYIAANFNNAAYGGEVSNWLLTPEVALFNGESLNFSLRLLGDGLLDRVEVYFSDDGASADISHFSLLTAFESDTDTGWQQRAALVNGLAAPASGRFAFRYVVDDTSLNGNYIGIDSVSINALAEPSSVALVLLGAIALGQSKRWRRRWVVAGGMAGAALAGPAYAAPPDQHGIMSFAHVQVVAQPVAQPVAPGGAFMAYKDPLTGQLTNPNPEQAALLTAASRGPAPLARQAPPQVMRAQHGGVRLKLDERQARYAVARKAPDGSTRETCEPAPGEQP
jgi:hypothetical protein